jgi:2-dehydropantoate 2-reductase
MRILVVGAGALGGYFGGRLLQAGCDVTFLVRARRAAQLRASGLVIRSPAGNFDLPNPPVLQSHELAHPFDLILLSCKAYDLAGAIDSFAPGVSDRTAILPLLNGMRHLETLEARFGAGIVMGGLCLISATLNTDGHILHLNDLHALTFGELHPSRSGRAAAILTELRRAPFEARLSDSIVLEMWEKWAFIATLAGVTCLMRATIGDVLAAGGGDLPAAIYDECARIAAENDYEPREPMRQRVLGVLTQQGSGLAASMLRDIENGGATEADHLLGDLVRRRRTASAAHSLLEIAYTHLKAYEKRRQRERAASAPTTPS